MPFATQSGNAQSSSGNVGTASGGLNQKAYSSSNTGIGSSSGSNSIGNNSANIPIPALQSRFQVRVESTPQYFNEQCIAFAMDLFHKDLIMIVEQSTTNPVREHAVIQDIISSPGRAVTFDIKDFQGNVVDTMRFRDCSITNHLIEFNYASSGAAVHVITMSYATVDMNYASKSNAAFNSAMGVVGRP